MLRRRRALMQNTHETNAIWRVVSLNRYGFAAISNVMRSTPDQNHQQAPLRLIEPELAAWAEKIAKLTPSPSQVAPSG